MATDWQKLDHLYKILTPALNLQGHCYPITFFSLIGLLLASILILDKFVPTQFNFLHRLGLLGVSLKLNKIPVLTL